MEFINPQDFDNLDPSILGEINNKSFKKHSELMKNFPKDLQIEPDPTMLYCKSDVLFWAEDAISKLTNVNIENSMGD